MLYRLLKINESNIIIAYKFGDSSKCIASNLSDIEAKILYKQLVCDVSIDNISPPIPTKNFDYVAYNKEDPEAGHGSGKTPEIALKEYCDLDIWRKFI